MYISRGSEVPFHSVSLIDQRTDEQAAGCDTCEAGTMLLHAGGCQKVEPQQDQDDPVTTEVTRSCFRTIP